ncbi:hypothetical protein C8F01DRAFT_772225 [Mycena amicta]|nr:hypothetical protein C8F01DRAFT_772225 [Mycena amicta]
MINFHFRYLVRSSDSALTTAGSVHWSPGNGLFLPQCPSPCVVHKIDVTSPLIQYTGPRIRGGSKKKASCWPVCGRPILHYTPYSMLQDTTRERTTQGGSGPLLLGSVERRSMLLENSGNPFNQVELSGQSFRSLVPSNRLPSRPLQSDKASLKALITNFVSTDKTYDVDFVCSSIVNGSRLFRLHSVSVSMDYPCWAGRF